MKIKIMVVLALGATGILFSQTDQLNSQKYWKFRNKLTESFVKVGGDFGESITAVTRKPGACPNNLPVGDGDTGPKGTIRWGDGMIMQGHYLGMLATEYSLLSEQDENLTATLNELYYAIRAVNRVDLFAEEIITTTDDNWLPAKAPSLNGFYLRDDAPNDFYLNWETADIKCKCVESDRFNSNNAAQLNEGANFARYKTTDHSIPSLDQMTSLLVGLSMCHKLLPDELYIQPTLDDPIYNMKAEIEAITHRLITYAKDHNWFLLDEYGWPVGNGGGDLTILAYPITLIGERITGIDYSSEFTRSIPGFEETQKYYSLPEDERAAYAFSLSEPILANILLYDLDNDWLDGSGMSNFEKIQTGSGSVTVATTDFAPFWDAFIVEDYDDLAADYNDDQKLQSLELGAFSSVKLKINMFSDYNLTILFNAGVAAGLFTAEQVRDWAVETENFQMIMTDAILNDRRPEFDFSAPYKEFLDDMPVYGGFKFHGSTWTPDPDDEEDKQIVWADGWGGEYKWNDPTEAVSADGHDGQFSGLDYLYFHNLYQIVFKDDIADSFEEKYGCICDDITQSDINGLTINDEPSADIEGRTLEDIVEFDFPIHSNVVFALSILEFCTPNVFKDHYGDLSSTLNLTQQFDDYHDIGILLNKYQTEEFEIQATGILNIENRLVVCDEKQLLVTDGGVINIDKGEIRVNSEASLVIEGTVNVSPNTSIIVEEGGKIIIRDGGTLNNSGYIRLKEGAIMEYEEGATLTMMNDFAEIHFDGGDLLIKENADFSVVKGTSQSGLLRFSTWGSHISAEANTSFVMEGNGEDDPIMIVEKNADFWIDSDDLNYIILLEGHVALDSNARFVGIQPTTLNDVHFEATEFNRGLVLFDKTLITGSVFDETAIYAPLFYTGGSEFRMTNSEVNSTFADEMVKIKGMGYNISNTEFNGSGYYMIAGQNTVSASYVTGCTFNGNASTVGIVDNSNATINIEGNIFNSLYAGVHKLDGRATVKCNIFDDFQFAGLIAHNNCVLDMSSNGEGGYNTFSKLDANFGQNISLWNARGLLLNQGLNTFDDQGSLPIIEGTMQGTTPPYVLSLLPANANDWNMAGLEPDPSEFSVTNAVGSTISFSTSAPSAAACPSELDDIISGSIDLAPNGGNSTYMVNTVNFDNVALDVALDVCITATEAYGGSSDLSALALFKEVLINYPLMDSSKETIWLVQHGAQKMKSTLQKLFSDEVIRPSDNVGSFHQGVQDYVDVLNALTTRNVESYNYHQMFYWELDKAHLFHLLGKRNLAILTLMNTESCGLDLVEQQHLNYWKYELDEEINKIAYGDSAEFIDTTWVDTALYVVPTNQQFGNFGSRIISPNNVEFFNCNNPRLVALDESTESTRLSVYPNPSRGVYNVSYTMPEESTGQIIVHGADGKRLYSFECESGSHTQAIDITGFVAGTYIYSFVVDGATKEQGKLILK